MKEPRICPVCGKPLPDIRGGRKAHAGFCARVRKADYMRVYMRAWYRKRKEKAKPPETQPPQAQPPQAAPQAAPQVDEAPPAPRRMTLDELAAKARSEGKSYGQLRAEMLLEQMKREKRQKLEETVSCLKGQITLDELIRLSRLEGETLRKWLVEMIRKQEEKTK